MTTPRAVHISPGEDTTEHVMGAFCPCKPAAEEIADADGDVHTIVYHHRQLWRATGAAPSRWEPDMHLVSAVLASPRAYRMADLSAADRAWVVAGLTLAGLTAKDINERLRCSLRLVKSIRAEDMTQVCTLMQQESQNFTDELRLEKSEHEVTRREAAEALKEADRVRRQRDRLLDEKITGGEVCSSGHTMDKYNTYVQAKTGKRFCRTCHRKRQAGYRAEKRGNQATIVLDPASTIFPPTDLMSLP